MQARKASRPFPWGGRLRAPIEKNTQTGLSSESLSLLVSSGAPGQGEEDCAEGIRRVGTQDGKVTPWVSWDGRLSPGWS